LEDLQKDGEKDKSKGTRLDRVKEPYRCRGNSKVAGLQSRQNEDRAIEKNRTGRREGDVGGRENMLSGNDDATRGCDLLALQANRPRSPEAES